MESTENKKKRPHIVIFNPDEMRWDCLGHIGINPATRTPFLDTFAASEAVSFDSAFCQNPVCVPSRCSFFTGLYPHVHGHRTMQHLLHGHEASLFSELKEAGYYVWMNTRNDLVAGQIPGLAESHASEIFYGEEGFRPPKPENPSPRGKQGDKNFYSHYEGRLRSDENGVCRTADDCVVDAAIDRILHPVDDRPMCLFLGLFYPHTPYTVSEPYFSAIDRSLLPRRASRGTGKPAMEEALRSRMGMEEYSEEDWNELRACYLGMCMKIDDQFRRLCDALKEAGIYDDTLIVFLSDHGDYAGNYDLPEKSQNTFEDCLTRVPLLVKPPEGRATDPGVSGALVELVDFYATVMDYAGVEPEHDHFGRSLRPVLADRGAAHREYVFCEGGRRPGELQSDEYHSVCGASGVIPPASLYWPKQTAQTIDDAHCKGTMIRDRDWKYVHRGTGAHELYDLRNDPLEEHNLFGEAAYGEEVLRLRMAMLDWYQTTCDVVPKKADARSTEKMTWHSLKGSVPEDMKETVFQLYREGMGLAAIKVRIAELLRERQEKIKNE